MNKDKGYRIITIKNEYLQAILSMYQKEGWGRGELTHLVNKFIKEALKNGNTR